MSCSNEVEMKENELQDEKQSIADAKKYEVSQDALFWFWVLSLWIGCVLIIAFRGFKVFEA